MKKKYYYCFNKNEKIIKSSSSGGVFYTIAKYLFMHFDNVKVFGCVLDEEFNAKHVCIDKLDNITPILGSKYVQSNLQNTFNEVKTYLLRECKVLYCGTPCQIKALKNYLNNLNINVDNLILIDFICHGVGNNSFFKDYINEMEQRYHSKAIYCNFRTKNRPGKLQDMSIKFENGKSYVASTTKFDKFYSAYLKNYIIKKSCFNCCFATTDRISDFTLSDAWDYKNKLCSSPSMISCNTLKAIKLFELINDNLIFQELTDFQVDDAEKRMCKKIKKPEDYEIFNDIYKSYGYNRAQKYLGNTSVQYIIKKVIADLLYKIKK